MSFVGCWLVVICWWLVVGCYLLVVGCYLGTLTLEGWTADASTRGTRATHCLGYTNKVRD
ncbi:MAG: hypothetical protein KME31_23160 [Tolypothrix carrinoi HA7290-LM1]|nr:hypothetical protein [Tolypothrix carrinoi HA7290-LM1]